MRTPAPARPQPVRTPVPARLGTGSPNRQPSKPPVPARLGTARRDLRPPAFDVSRPSAGASNPVALAGRTAAAYNGLIGGEADV